MVKWLQKMVFVGCFALSTTAHAIEFDVQAEFVRWQYQEYAKDAVISATQASFLPSKSQGSAGLIQLNLSTERDNDWFVGLSGSLMDSTANTTERWASKQTNDLSIKQLDIRLDVQKEVMQHGKLGFWLSQREQEQSRQSFVVNGVATAVAGEPIVEKITSHWLGLSFIGTGGRQNQLEARIDVAMPLKVDVSNPLFTAPFSKKTGYQTGIHFRWQLPKSEVGVSGLNLTLDYQYQELGGEKQTSGNFWPYNRWQTVGFGLLYAW